MRGLFSSFRSGSLRAIALVAAISSVVAATAAQAQQDWNPFREKDELAARKKVPAQALPPALPPMNGPAPVAANQSGYGTAYPGQPAYEPPFVTQPGSAPRGTPSADTRGMPQGVERTDLPPAGEAAAATETPPERKPGLQGAGLQGDIWRGLDLAGIEQLVARANVPPRSPALFSLWIALLTADATPPAGSNPVHLRAVQMEGLYRSGAIAELTVALGPSVAGAQDPLVTAFRIRRDLAEGNREAVCEATRGLILRRAELPKTMRGELHLLSGYCAAADKNSSAAGLAAELAREEGIDAPLALAVLDSIAGGAPPNLQLPKRILLLDYRLLELLGPVDPSQIVDKAEPALLAALAAASTAEPALRATAAEAAARINAIAPAILAAAYRAVQAMPDNDADPVVRRALILQAFDREPSGPRRDQFARILLDDARKAGLYAAAAVLVAAMPQDALTLDAAGVTVETALAAGHYSRVRALAERQPQLAHWLALADVFDPAFRGNREQNLASLDEHARRARVSSDALHKLATVLDALDINVPVPLWEAASRTAPPNGYLPETGVLAQLDDAAKKKEIARTILLSLTALGPNGAANGPDGAHIIALGDTIRALRRAGLDVDARRLGLEAVLAVWPKAQAS